MLTLTCAHTTTEQKKKMERGISMLVDMHSNRSKKKRGVQLRTG